MIIERFRSSQYKRMHRQYGSERKKDYLELHIVLKDSKYYRLRLDELLAGFGDRTIGRFRSHARISSTIYKHCERGKKGNNQGYVFLNEDKSEIPG